MRPNSFALLCALALAACGGPSTLDDGSTLDDLRRRHDGGTPGLDAGTPHVPPGGACTSDLDCLSGDLCTSGTCTASACNQRHSGVTGIRATVRIDQYKGLIHGRNGTHEIATGTLQKVLWIYRPSVEDTASVQLAMNVASAIDPQGLPREVPLAAGQVIEVEGEYIPGATASARGRAVIHYTHGACGFADIGGVIY